ncbi:MAG: dockerin type I repeat-containing protein [Oscillospiraceae bacterium]|nr:dockerin type I repeat-containing protein [Oscillospiraceae bacterium]
MKKTFKKVISAVLAGAIMSTLSMGMVPSVGAEEYYNPYAVNNFATDTVVARYYTISQAIFECCKLGVGYEVRETFQNRLSTVLRYKVGDANMDSLLNQADVDFIKHHLLYQTTLTPSQRSRADVNDDGSVDIQDAALIRRFIVNNSGVE